MTAAFSWLLFLQIAEAAWQLDKLLGCVLKLSRSLIALSRSP
jgi:hypothetical protein